jgi:aspartate/methionine/tyrosine aminotransferase
MSLDASNRARAITFNAIFSKMNALAKEHGAINLGHGFPDYSAPDFIKTAVCQAIMDDRNQYTAPRGAPALRQALVDRMQQRYGVDYNPDTDVVVTQGATEAIFAAMMGFVNPGDEVVLFEPCYSTYRPAIQMVGGIPKFYSLLPPDWTLDPERLESLFSQKTKVVLLNTPHNPTGKVFTHEEMVLVSRLCQKYDAIAISDEVYDELVFDGTIHRALCTYSGMYDRTITVSTIGKTFAVTGWKVGWAIAPPALSDAILRIRLYTSGSGTTPVQEASAQALNASPEYYEILRAEYTELRNYCCDLLTANGFLPFRPAGGFFLMAEAGQFSDMVKKTFDNDVELCLYLTKTVGVTAIPASALYHYGLPPESQMLRFAFCKKKSTLAAAKQRLSAAIELVKSSV